MKQHSLAAVIGLSKIVRLAREKCSPQDAGTLARAVGDIIGRIETDVLAAIYREFPQLDDLA